MFQTAPGNIAKLTVRILSHSPNQIAIHLPGPREGHGVHGAATDATFVQDAPSIFSVEDATGNTFRLDDASSTGHQCQHRLHRLG
jgi:hypothetical protein